MKRLNIAEEQRAGGLSEGKKFRGQEGILEGKKVRGLEGKLFNNRDVSENSQQQQFDNSLTSCPPALRTSKKAAFTLAEVLITLAVIGVVAAMTLPIVINNIQEKQFHSKFKKAYATFSQATQKIYAEDGEFSTYYHTIWGEYICKLDKHIKFTACGTSCGNKYPYVRWHENLKWFDKKDNPQSFSGNASYNNFAFTTTDGTMYMLYCDNDVLVDVNGFSKPNKIGKDIYYFKLRSATNQPYYPSSGSIMNCNNNNYTKPVSITDSNYKTDCKSGTGWGCSRMVINNEL